MGSIEAAPFNASTRWFYFAEEREIGPIHSWKLLELITKGVLDEAALVKRAGETEFRPLCELFPASGMISEAGVSDVDPPPILPPETLRCARCADAVPVEDHFEFEQLPFCEECIPACFPELSGYGHFLPYPEAQRFDPDAPACSLCRKRAKAEELLAFESVHLCPDCKPGYFQRLREGALERKPVLNHAPIGNRFAARFVDGLVFKGVGMFAGALLALTALPVARLELAVAALLLSLELVYFTMCTGVWGQTLGKRLASVKVVSADGGRVSILQALVRHFVSILSLLLCGAGYLIALFDPENRTLHDRIASTRVVRDGNEIKVW